MGAYIGQNNPTELLFLVGLGVLATILRLASFPLAPLLIGFILGPMLENNFSRNPTGVIKFSINNNRMILEEITDNWEHILNEYTNAIIDIHLIQLERIERERENNNITTLLSKCF